jgi:hypothetical protein
VNAKRKKVRRTRVGTFKDLKGTDLLIPGKPGCRTVLFLSLVSSLTGGAFTARPLSAFE